MAGLPVVILCGGRGTRAYPDTQEVPKPLLPVAGVPVVEHVMGIYAARGHTEFVLAAGYLAELLVERYSGGRCPGVPRASVRVVDTGLETETGERLRLAAEHVEGPRFMATYSDGLADIDLDELLGAHTRAGEEHGALATVTTVPLPSPYGTVETTGAGRVTRFREKPRLADHRINAGFFVFDRAVFGPWSGQVLETEVLPGLAGAGVLHAYHHEGFWKSLDTFKDRLELDALAAGGHPPWGALSG